MTTRDIVRFQFGRPEAIIAVAKSKAALPTALLLVLLTAIARSYDQTWIGEGPILWIFGPLLFSMVSGTWLFLIVYAGFLRAHWGPEEKWSSAWKDWPSFMGVYWMTAPTGWLYAIPVERFFGDILAAQANLTLLAIVSSWRVLLFSRIIQVLGGVKYGMAAAWVSLAACFEACVVLFFTSFGQALGRSMGGLRNSPAEDVILNAFGFAMIAAFWTGIIALAVSCIWHPKTPTLRLKPREQDSPPRSVLVTLFALWTFIALWIQPSVRRNARAEELVYSQHYRDALDFLASHKPADFAPSRPLPPKAYERSSFLHTTSLVAAMTVEDPEWLRVHMIRRLNEVVDSVRRGRRSPSEGPQSDAELADDILQSFFLYGLQPKDVLQLTESFATQAWLAPWTERNRGFLIAVMTHARDEATVEWQRVLESLGKQGIQPQSDELPSPPNESDPGQKIKSPTPHP